MTVRAPPTPYEPPNTVVGKIHALDQAGIETEIGTKLRPAIANGSPRRAIEVIVERVKDEYPRLRRNIACHEARNSLQIGTGGAFGGLRGSSAK
jgi:hypothetical protein